MDDFDRALGEAIRSARVARGLSLRELSRRSGSSFKPSSLGGYERGERALSVRRLVLLARAMGTTPESILSDALARIGPGGRREIVLDLGRLPEGSVGAAAAAHAHLIRSLRGDYLSPFLTLRSGDLEVIASAANLRPDRVVTKLGKAVHRLGP